jgi:hypothetical protein
VLKCEFQARESLRTRASQTRELMILGINYSTHLRTRASQTRELRGQKSTVYTIEQVNKVQGFSLNERAGVSLSKLRNVGYNCSYLIDPLMRALFATIIPMNSHSIRLGLFQRICGKMSG